MTKISALLVISSVAIAAAPGCGEPGVTNISRVKEAPMESRSAATAAGSSAAAVPSSGAAGSTASDADMSTAKCPTGWACNDLSSFGVVATDGAGKPISFSCGNGMLVDCKDADPKASCGPLTNPVCAHLSVGGMDLISCGQRCTP
jgi:hypothetical protein